MSDRDITLKIVVDGSDAEREIERLRGLTGGGGSSGGGAGGAGGRGTTGAAPVRGRGGGGAGAGFGEAAMAQQLGAILRKLAVIVALLEIFEPIIRLAAQVLRALKEGMWKLLSFVGIDMAAIDVNTTAQDRAREQLTSTTRGASMSDEQLNNLYQALLRIEKMYAQSQRNATRVATNAGISDHIKSVTEHVEGKGR